MFLQYSFGADPVKTLLEPLEKELLKTTHTYCGKNYPLFTKRLARSLEGLSRRFHVEGDASVSLKPLK